MSVTHVLHQKDHAKAQGIVAETLTGGDKTTSTYYLDDFYPRFT